MKKFALTFLAGAVSAPLLAHAAPAKLDVTITDIVGRRLVVESAEGKLLVDLGPKAAGQSALKVGDKISVEGDLKKDDEFSAHQIVAANGQTYVLRKENEGWLEWLTGNKPEPPAPFTAADAKKVATDKGYTVEGEPAADKKHFVATAKKDGKTFEIDIHRDGNVVEKTPFSADEAKALVTKDGYEVVGAPKPEKEHFQMLAKKGDGYFAVDAHRDQTVKEVRKVDKTDIKWGPMIP